MNFVEELIKKKFKLFKGLRSKEEDRKILEKLMDLCFDEIMLFLSENLSETQKKSLKKELESQTSIDEKINSLTKHLTSTQNFDKRIIGRIDGFLNNLLYSSLQA